MYNLVISFEDSDTELKTALKEQFGSDLKYSSVKNFDGLNIFLTVIIPITSLTVGVFDFILTHFANKEKPASPLPKRLIIDKEGNIDLTNYSSDEAIQILKAYFENQKNNET